MGLFNKKELKIIDIKNNRIVELEGIVNKYGISDIVRLEDQKSTLKNEVKSLQNEINDLKSTINSLKADKLSVSQDYQNAKNEYDKICSDIDLTEYGVYKPTYNFIDSIAIKDAIEINRTKQKNLIKSEQAVSCSTEWTVNGSRSKGIAKTNSNIKMLLRAFNNECDYLIKLVKYNNFENVKGRIEKSANALNKLNTKNALTINTSLIDLKISELTLVHEYQLMKEKEKEELRAQREEERELKKVEDELRAARKIAEKELTHYKQAYERLMNFKDDSKYSAVEFAAKEAEIKEHISRIEENIKNLDYRELNKRAGYVYIISNIGAFGENVYKIGMTRRLEPMDRVDELGDASVPFKFDVHAMIFSDDAPSLESNLHDAFANKRLNMVNNRKEFFRVDLDEIEYVVKKHHDKLVEFKKRPDAQQYRESLKIN